MDRKCLSTAKEHWLHFRIARRVKGLSSKLTLGHDTVVRQIAVADATRDAWNFKFASVLFSLWHQHLEFPGNQNYLSVSVLVA